MSARYLLEQRIGIGGMAEVFRARHEGSGEVCAIKRLRPEQAEATDLRQRLRDEIRIASRLHHPCVVAVHDSYELDGKMHLVMEYVDGISVEHLITRGLSGAFIPSAISAYIVREAAKGLAHAHAEGVLHRDVSASNILASATGDVKLADFGLADAAGRVAVTAPGEVIGKWTYLSPRRRRGEPATPEDDLFALGVVIARLIATEDPRQRSPVRDSLIVLRDRLAQQEAIGSADEVVAAIGEMDVADASDLASFLRQPVPGRRRAVLARPVDLNATTRPTGKRRK